MSPLVRIPQAANEDLPIAGLDGVLGSGLAGQDAAVAPSDNYLVRIAKYVPGEVLAFFIFINAILEQAVKTGGSSAVMAGVPVVGQGALLLGFVLTPLFIWYVREEGDAWFTNAVVSTIAFPFWAYVLGAVAFDDHWDGNLAAILLATLTVMSGLISPRVRRPKRKQAKPPSRPDRPHLDPVEPTSA